MHVFGLSHLDSLLLIRAHNMSALFGHDVWRHRDYLIFDSSLRMLVIKQIPFSGLGVQAASVPLVRIESLGSTSNTIIVQATF